MIKEGEYIKIKGKKRLWVVVKKRNVTISDITLTCKPIYKPSPRSRLRNRTIFSKVKINLLFK